MTKKIGSGEMKRFVKALQVEPAECTVEVTAGGEALRITVKPYLSFAERGAFISGAVEMCFDDGGIYRPWIREFAWWYQILQYYTNLSSFSAPEPLWSLASRTDVIEKVLDCVKDDTCAMYAEISTGIDYRIQASLKSNKWDALADGFASLLSQFERALLEAAQKEKISSDGNASDRVSAGGSASAVRSADAEKAGRDTEALRLQPLA